MNAFPPRRSRLDAQSPRTRLSTYLKDAVNESEGFRARQILLKCPKREAFESGVDQRWAEPSRAEGWANRLLGTEVRPARKGNSSSLMCFGAVRSKVGRRRRLPAASVSPAHVDFASNRNNRSNLVCMHFALVHTCARVRRAVRSRTSVSSCKRATSRNPRPERAGPASTQTSSPLSLCSLSPGLGIGLDCNSLCIYVHRNSLLR